MEGDMDGESETLDVVDRAAVRPQMETSLLVPSTWLAERVSEVAKDLAVPHHFQLVEREPAEQYLIAELLRDEVVRVTIETGLKRAVDRLRQQWAADYRAEADRLEAEARKLRDEAAGWL